MSLGCSIVAYSMQQALLHTYKWILYYCFGGLFYTSPTVIGNYVHHILFNVHAVNCKYTQAKCTVLVPGEYNAWWVGSV